MPERVMAILLDFSTVIIDRVYAYLALNHFTTSLQVSHIKNTKISEQVCLTYSSERVREYRL